MSALRQELRRASISSSDNNSDHPLKRFVFFMGLLSVVVVIVVAFMIYSLVLYEAPPPTIFLFCFGFPICGLWFSFSQNMCLACYPFYEVPANDTQVFLTPMILVRFSALLFVLFLSPHLHSMHR